MRIFYIVDLFPAISHVFISREISKLEEKGFEIQVLSLHKPEYGVFHEVDRKYVKMTIYSETLKVPKIKKALFHALYLLRAPIHYVKSLAASKTPGLPGMYYKFTQLPLVCDLVSSFGPQRIHCHFGREGMLYGWLISKMINIPFSVTLHGSDVLFSPYDRLGVVLNDADRIICVSETIRNAVIERFRIKHDKARLVRCGVPLDLYRAVEKSNSGPKILTVARLHPVKGLEYSIEACSILANQGYNLEWNIYGEGPERGKLQKMINDKNLNEVIRLRGPAQNEDLPNIYAQHSLFVLSSLSEGVPVVLMEAMATGLPIVAPNVGGIPEIVKNGENGYLVSPRDPCSLAEAIKGILKFDDDKLKKIAKTNRKKIQKNFNLDIEIDKLATLFKDGYQL